MKTKILISLFSVLILAGCNATTSSEISAEESTEASSSIAPFSIDENATRANPIIVNLSEIENPQPIPLVGPFTILDENGGQTSLKTDTYDNMYTAIRVAGSKSSTQNVYQVQDSQCIQIFIRSKTTYGFVFDGADYVGYGSSKKCKAYCFSHPSSYAVNGKGTDYLYLGRKDMVEGQTVTENVLETYAGAYNYMFSKGGSNVNKLGYRYASADVLLSETKYIAPTDGGTWNAYIFINMAEGISADLGLIGVRANNRVEWWLFRSCGSSSHSGANNNDKDATFYVFQKTLITYSTKYDETTSEYSGFDDLHFETAAFDDGWWLEITNLRTNEKLTLDHRHTDSEGAQVKENPDGVSTRVLIASSFCPVTNNVWNWKCGAALTNVVWTNIALKKSLKTDSGLATTVEEYRNVEESYELYPGSETYRDGYSQGGYCASHEFSTFQNDGQTAGGFNYKAGQKYISYSVDYR